MDGQSFNLLAWRQTFPRAEGLVILNLGMRPLGDPEIQRMSPSTLGGHAEYERPAAALRDPCLLTRRFALLRLGG